MKRKARQQSKAPSHRDLRLTETGRGILIGTIFTFLACLFIPAFGVFAALIVLQAVALGIGWWFRPRLHIHGAWPDHTMAGHFMHARFTLENRSKSSAYHLLMAPVEWPPEIEPRDPILPIPSLAPGQQRFVTLSARCHRRGRYRLEIPTCFSSFPFNLYRFGSRKTTAQDVLVLPNYHRLELHSLASSQGGGIWSGRNRNLTGLSPEYVGSRPFLPGDSPRRIDARAWARLAVPAVKEFFDESQQTVALVLDTWLGEGASGNRKSREDDFEAAVSLTASVAYSLPDSATLDTLITGTEVHFIPGKNLGHQVERVHRVLATVKALDQTSSQKLPDDVMDRLHTCSEIFVIGVAWQPQIQHLVTLAQQCGCRVSLYRIGADRSERNYPIEADLAPIHIPNTFVSEEGESL